MPVPAEWLAELEIGERVILIPKTATVGQNDVSISTQTCLINGSQRDEKRHCPYS
jgi:hypothetical protein